MTAENATIRARTAEAMRAWYSREQRCSVVACTGCRAAAEEAAVALAEAGVLAVDEPGRQR